MLLRPCKICLVFSVLTFASLDARAQLDGAADGAGPTCAFTQYAGDEYCVDPPAPPAEGFQLHLGPASYDAAGVTGYLVPPGQDRESCFYSKTPNTSEVFARTLLFSARPLAVRGSVWLLPTSVTTSTIPEPCSVALLQGARLLSLTTQLRQDVAFANGAPENEALAYAIPPNAQVAFRIQYVNTTIDSVLEEAWFNVLTAPDAGFVRVDGMELRGRGQSVPPQSTVVHDYRCTPGQEVRIVQMGAVVSPSVSRLSVYRVTAAGSRERVYESYDWATPPLLSYDTVTLNIEPDAAQRRSGGSSGVLNVGNGEALEWECDFDNATDRALTYESPSFFERATCNVFGYVVGSSAAQWNCPFLNDPPDAGSDSGSPDAGPPPDAAAGSGGRSGAGGAGGSIAAGAGGSIAAGAGGTVPKNDAGLAAPAGVSDDDGGCGCRVHGTSSVRLATVFGGLALLCIALRRARR